MARPQQPPHGEKLQMLIDADCITVEGAAELGPTQLSAIEQLSYAQIGTLIDTRKAVGEVMISKLI